MHDDYVALAVCEPLFIAALFLLCASTQQQHLHRVCSLFSVVMSVPLCPPGLQSCLAKHFRIHGWCWDDELLLKILGQLADEGIHEPGNLPGVEVVDISGHVDWPADVQSFFSRLCKVSMFSMICHIALFQVAGDT